MRVLVVDDSEEIRMRLVPLLAETAGVTIVGQATTVTEAIDAVRRLKPDVMTLDLHLPDGNGLDVLRLIQRERLPTKVIVLTNYAYPPYEKHARAAGACAFLDKARDFVKIPDVLLTLM